MDNPFTLAGKTILVTGASSGIGRGIAVACAGMGAKVILTARNEIRLQETLFLLEGDGHSYICADLTKAEDRQHLVEQLPLLDGLVQCAGVMSRVPCKAIGAEDIQQVFQPNVEAPMLLQAELLQEKKIAKSASIVYIASIAARSAVAGNALYSASKAALISYAKCLSLELAPRMIRVNCICPAMVWTDLALVGATQEELDADQAKYPLKRYGRPEDIANLAIYLLSNASAWMTGSCVEITGGGNELIHR
ncbi:MAG: SDR family oxidoreductase [Paludibacteraceae bacterium]|nr:SDR family oxidoreductase [Paludibacteraceae bacterium]